MPSVLMLSAILLRKEGEGGFLERGELIENFNLQTEELIKAFTVATVCGLISSLGG